MPVLSETPLLSSAVNALERLNNFVTLQRSKSKPSADFEHFERELHSYFVAAEREVLGEELSRWDLNVPIVEIDGEKLPPSTEKQDKLFKWCGWRYESNEVFTDAA